MATFSAKKSTRETITAEEYLRRRNKDPKSVEGAKILVPKSLGSHGFGGFEIERDVPQYEILPTRK